MKNTIIKPRTSLEKINEFSKSLGLSKEQQTILEVVSSSDNQKILSLKNGSYDNPEPWFIIDENDEVHTAVSIASIKDMLENLRQLRKENFELRLEKAIFQQVPIDFNDVWVVAMDEIKTQMINGANDFSIDLDSLVANIKKEHPNLFVDVQAFLEQKNK